MISSNISTSPFNSFETKSPSRKRKFSSEEVNVPKQGEKKQKHGIGFYLITLPIGAVYITCRVGVSALKAIKQSTVDIVIDIGKESAKLTVSAFSESMKLLGASSKVIKEMAFAIEKITRNSFMESSPYANVSMHQGYLLINNGSRICLETGNTFYSPFKELIPELMQNITAAAKQISNGTSSTMQMKAELLYLFGIPFFDIKREITATIDPLLGESKKAFANTKNIASEGLNISNALLSSLYLEGNSYSSVIVKQIKSLANSSIVMGAEEIAFLDKIVKNLCKELVEDAFIIAKQGVQVSKNTCSVSGEGAQMALTFFVKSLKETFSYCAPGCYQLEHACANAVAILLEIIPKTTLQKLIFELLSYRFPVKNQCEQIAIGLSENAALTAYILQKISTSIIIELVNHGGTLSNQVKMCQKELSKVEEEISEFALDMYQRTIVNGYNECNHLIIDFSNQWKLAGKGIKEFTFLGKEAVKDKVIKGGKQCLDLLSSGLQHSQQGLKNVNSLAVEGLWHASRPLEEMGSHLPTSSNQLKLATLAGSKILLESTSLSSDLLAYFSFEVIYQLITLNSEAAKTLKSFLKTNMEGIYLSEKVIRQCAEEIANSMNSTQYEAVKFAKEIPNHLIPVGKVTTHQIVAILLELFKNVQDGSKQSNELIQMLTEDSPETFRRVVYIPWLLNVYYPASIQVIKAKREVTQWFEDMKKGIRERIEEFQRWRIPNRQ